MLEGLVDVKNIKTNKAIRVFQLRQRAVPWRMISEQLDISIHKAQDLYRHGQQAVEHPNSIYTLDIPTSTLCWLRFHHFIELPDVIQAIKDGRIHWLNDKDDNVGKQSYEGLCQALGITPLAESPLLEWRKQIPKGAIKYLDRLNIHSKQGLIEAIQQQQFTPDKCSMGARTYYDLCCYAGVSVDVKTKEKLANEINRYIAVLEHYGYKVIQPDSPL